MFALLNSFTFAPILKHALQIFKQFAGIQNLRCNILTLIHKGCVRVFIRRPVETGCKQSGRSDPQNAHFCSLRM